jgi:glycosyltransferase involved in cell wall biosynthesis
MDQPTLCMIFDVIGGQSAIGKVAANDVRIALEAGYKVTAVARDLAQDLKSNVEWLRLHVPKRLFAYQWLSGRRLIRKALGTRRFDIIHAHQPQIADLSDIFQCHYLTRMAYLKQCLEFRRGFKPRVLRLQQQIVLYAEDFYYRRWNPATQMLYGSDRTRDDFHRLYGPLPHEAVLVLNCEKMQIATPEEKRHARLKLLGREYPGKIVGFLGGVQRRKGFDRIVEAVRREPGLFLLIGGPFSEGLNIPELAGRFLSLGEVADTDTFYAACDAFAVPSRYEPLGLVAFEAAARGVPVFATAEVGALPHLLRHGAGVRWNPDEPLGPLVGDLCEHRTEFNAGAARLASESSLGNYAAELRKYYEAVLAGKGQKEKFCAAH